MPLLTELSEAVGGELRNSDGTETANRVAYDSRRVQPADIFVAIPGFKEDGARFVADALYRGASAVICESEAADKLSSPCIVVENARAALARAAWMLAGFPQERLGLIGVTGTNGKTTVTSNLAELLNRCGVPTGVCGTLGMHFGSLKFESDRTTAEAPELARAFSEMLNAGCSRVALEATSIGIDLHRLDMLRFDIAVFTNLSRDHLDFHGSWEAYRDSKLKLFGPEMLKGTAIINADDAESGHFIKCAGSNALTYGLDSDAIFRAEDVRFGTSGTSFSLFHEGMRREVRTAFIGRFNVHNSLAVIASAFALGVPLDQILEVIRGLQPVRGRAELIQSSAPFAVIVDYAHTPDALIKILSSVRSIATRKLVVLIGAGGDRDKGKRPLMAQAAEEHSDEVYLTSDNPRSENPNAILDDMKAGLEHPERARIVVNRRDAILESLSRASAGDVIVIAGKGHETYQEIQGVKLDFDDRAVAEEWLREHSF
ncbi:MAG: UDP-N-acetylmuramoyl-L-alanyl-D-glutamate--2,6-diaminopimelate ligase [Calditrichaeota bacterium]|nr:UDP-N-acetylmuramoyl-L-alanyl-D-glutamate--2,6-diaminopimelate ligase [Calditrichota bacterium]MCB9391065.1 UDP-N-acetylmuramoyl-L-alanyl-D-glutamate--2,6-diaminopimelate ligase [Calditrichota bacterium]